MELEKYWKKEYSRRAVVREKYYAKAGQTEYSFNRRLKYFKKYYKKIRRKHNKPLKILDLGCGPGTYLYEILKENNKDQIIGIDFSYEMLVFGRSEYKLRNLICADMRYLPITDNSFELLYCMGVLQDVTDPERIIHLFYQILKPGGICFLNTISSTCRIKAHPKILVSYTPSEIKNVFERTGFKQVEVIPLLLSPKCLKIFDFLDKIKWLHPILWPISHDLIVIAVK